MVVKRGVSLLDLIDLPQGTVGLLPDKVLAAFEAFAITDLVTTTTPGAYIRRGQVNSVGEATGNLDWTDWPIEVPGLNTGLRFQLTTRRAGPGGGPGAVEGFPPGWRLELMLDRVSVRLDRLGLKPARLIEADSITSRHLVPDPQRKDVRLVGSAVLRFDFQTLGIGGGGPVWNMSLARHPDPLDPDAPTGAILGLSFDPPHFQLGSSGFGITVRKVTIDDDAAYSPEDVIALGLSDDWTGVLIQEATVYLPTQTPLVGPASSVGARDLRLSRQFGVQGELNVEFGVDGSMTEAFTFKQRGDKIGETVLPKLAPHPDDQDLGVITYTRNLGRDTGEVRIDADNSSKRLRFEIPGGRTLEGNSSGWFDVAPDDRVLVSTIEKDAEGQEIPTPKKRFSFVPGDAPVPPTIRLTWQGPSATHTFDEVLFISGRLERLGTLHCEAVPAAPPTDESTLKWTFGAGLHAPTGSGASYDAIIPDTLGKVDLVLRDALDRPRRLRIEVVTAGPIVIGTRAGAFLIDEDDARSALDLLAVEAVHDGAVFHDQGELRAVTPDSAPFIHPDFRKQPPELAKGTIAAVTVAMGHADNPHLPPSTKPASLEVQRHVQVLMRFAGSEDYAWGEQGLWLPYSPAVLQVWKQWFGPDARFVVIGRTCDLGGEDLNAQLAEARARAGVALLAPTQLSEVSARGERTPPTGDAATREAQVAGGLPEPTIGSLLESRSEPQLAGGHDLSSSEVGLPVRKRYRRIDIHAVGGSEPDILKRIEADYSLVGPSLRRVLLPAEDLDLPVIAPAKAAATPYRASLRLRWDNPVWTGPENLIPSLAELEIRWTRQQAEQKLQALEQHIPDDQDENGPPPPSTLEGPELYRLLGRWTHDARSGATRFSLAFDNPGENGICASDNRFLAGILMLGPPLVSGLPADAHLGKAVRLSALIGLGAAAARFATAGRVVLHGVELQEEQPDLGNLSLAAARHRLLFDYTSAISVNIVNGVLNISTTNPLKVRYENVGLEYDGISGDGWGLVYDEARFDVEDPGEWKIGGVLGELLRVSATRAGAGSIWFEVDLKIAKNLGPVELTTATIRVTMPKAKGDVPKVELRGIGCKLDVPGTLSGEGTLSITNGGFSSSLKVNVIPAKLEAAAALAIASPFSYVSVEVKLPAGIPLAGTGLGLFGFIGRFAINGSRDLDRDATDPVAEEIRWYRKPVADKYRPDEGQHALGLGVIIGALPDQAYSMNATGMLSIAFPDPEVVLSVDGKLMTKPPAGATDDAKSSEPNGLELLGLIAVSGKGLLLAVDGRYAIPQLLDLKVPMGAWFPFGTEPWFLRIGSDGYGGRPGERVTLTLFPDTLKFRCWAYVMLDSKGLPDLGHAAQYGLQPIHLDGFSVGLGVGFDLKHAPSHGLYSLSASAALVVGMGTRPLLLAGLLHVEGTARLLVVSLSVEGKLQGTIRHQVVDDQALTRYRIHGQLTGSIVILGEKISETVEATLQSKGSLPAPTPDPILVRIDLIDRQGGKTGEATSAGDAVVWPDTTPVLNFSHPIRSVLPADHPFKVGTPAAGPLWCGSTRRKYAYRLRKLELREVDGQGNETLLTEPMDSVWWWPTHRGVLLDPDGPPPSEDETRSLALLSWHPAPLLHKLADGGAGGPADPANTLPHICTPAVSPQRNFAPPAAAVSIDDGILRFTTPQPTPPPLVNAFSVEVRSSHNGQDWDELAAILPASGRKLAPAGLAALPSTLTPPGETTAIGIAWRLPAIREQECFERTLDLHAELIHPLIEPQLNLAIWDRKDRRAQQVSLCDDFGNLKRSDSFPTTLSRSIGSFRALAAGAALRAVDLDGNGVPDKIPGGFELQGGGGIEVKFSPAVDSAAVDLLIFGGAVMLRAYNAAGTLVAMADSAAGTLAAPPSKQSRKLFASGIVRLTLIQVAAPPGYSHRHEFSLRRLCVNRKQALPPIGLPTVFGLRDGASAIEAWTVKHVGSHPAPGGGSLQLLRCTPPVGPGSPPGIWKHFAVPSFGGAHLLLLGVSGIDWQAADLAAQNKAVQDEIKNGNGNPDAGNGPDGGAGELPTKSEKRRLLTPGRRYRIVVGTDWAGWDAPSDGASPPSTIAEGKWTPFPEQVHEFGIASEIAGDAVLAAPVQMLDERHFDPRAITRYLRSLGPDGHDPHYLDDLLAARFEVDYVEALLARYQRLLDIRLRRTDPPAGSLASGGEAVDSGGKPSHFETPPNLEIAIVNTGLPEAVLLPGDQWFADPAGQAPCVELEGPSGLQKLIAAPLEAQARYDLILVAPPKEAPLSDSVHLARCHFRTSRYSGPAAQLAALGLGLAPDPAGTTRPHDLYITAASLPTLLPIAKQADLELEGALGQLGLSPLPLPPHPRLSVLWWRNALGQYQLHGVLLDSDEALIRPGRLKLDSLLLMLPPQSPQSLPVAKPLSLVRCNASATRLLFWSQGGCAFTTGHLHLQATGTALDLQPQVPPVPIPVPTPVAKTFTGICRMVGEPRSISEGGAS